MPKTQRKTLAIALIAMQSGGEYDPRTTIQQFNQYGGWNGGGFINQQQVSLHWLMQQIVRAGKQQLRHTIRRKRLHPLKHGTCRGTRRSCQYDSLSLLQKTSRCYSQSRTLAPTPVGRQYQCSTALLSHRQHTFNSFSLVQTQTGLLCRLRICSLRQPRPSGSGFTPAQQLIATLKSAAQVLKKVAIHVSRSMGFHTQRCIFRVIIAAPLIGSGCKQQQHAAPSDSATQLAKGIGIETGVRINNGKVERCTQNTVQLSSF
jgi:hypothetical protein